MSFTIKLGLLILGWVRVYHCREVPEQSLLSFAEVNSLGIAGRREEMREERIVKWIIVYETKVIQLCLEHSSVGKGMDSTTITWMKRKGITYTSPMLKGHTLYET